MPKKWTGELKSPRQDLHGLRAKRVIRVRKVYMYKKILLEIGFLQRSVFPWKRVSTPESSPSAAPSWLGVFATVVLRSRLLFLDFQ